MLDRLLVFTLCPLCEFYFAYSAKTVGKLPNSVA